MMASTLHKNAILTGCVDSYCLVCEAHLRTEEDVIAHINKPIHQKNLNSSPYLQKFCDDHIRKVKKGYFCEFCNLLLPTAAKVGLHVEENNHKNNRGIILIKRTCDKVIIGDNISISEQAWNGIIVDTCAVCNMEFTNMRLHIADQKHVLNLIQKKVEFVNGSTVYRKIDETSFHCLVCNAIYSLNNLLDHSKHDVHKTQVERCRTLFKQNYINREPVAVTEKVTQIANSNINSELTADDKKLNEAKPKIATDNVTKVENCNATQKVISDDKINKETTTKTHNKTQFDKKEKYDDEEWTDYEDDNSSDYVTEDDEETKMIDDRIRAALNVFLLKEKIKEKQREREIAESNKKKEIETKNKTKSTNANGTESTCAKSEKSKSFITVETNAAEKVNKNTSERLKSEKPRENSDEKRNKTNLTETIKPQSTKATNLNNEKVRKLAESESKEEIGIINNKNKESTNVVELGNATNDKSIAANNNESKATDKQDKCIQTQRAILIPKPIKKSKKHVETTTKEEVVERAAEFQKNGININFETESVFCKKCFGSVGLNIEDIDQHIEDHKINVTEIERPVTHVLDQNNSKTILNEKVKLDDVKKPKMSFDVNHNETRNKIAKEDEEIIKIDLRKHHFDVEEESSTEKMLVKYDFTKQNITENLESEARPSTEPNNATAPNPDDPATFAEANQLTYNKNKSNVFCRICNKKIPASIKNMKEHVAGGTHKSKVGMINARAKQEKRIRKKALAKFIEQRTRVLNDASDDVIINDKYVLSRLSYLMITECNRLRCQACEVNLEDDDDVDQHLDSFFHERAMDSTPVVLNFDSEFIREVRREIFHCGFCNLIVGEWEDVSNHLKCEDHKENKDLANVRLREHLPSIRRHRQEQERGFFRYIFGRFF